MKTPVSPKVTTGGIWAGYATLLLALLNTVTPTSLDFLGHLAPVGYGVVIGGAYALGAWLKEDPLRTAGLAAQPTATAQAASPLSSFVQSITAPAKTFPAAQVDAATATAAAPSDPAPEAAPATVTPVYTPPAAAAAAPAADPAQPATPPTA